MEEVGFVCAVIFVSLAKIVGQVRIILIKSSLSWPIEELVFLMIVFNRVPEY